MKEFLKNKTITYNLMSFTGFKALILFSLLMESPKSYKEICEYFVEHPYLKESISIDTLRVYINSLRRIGCDVKRVREDKVSKYVILSNPFQLEITQEQINSITKVYKNLTKNIEINELIMLEKFLQKIANFPSNKEFLNILNKISVFSDVDMSLTEEIVNCCERKDQIVISYNSPNSGIKDIELLTDKVEFSNNKFYLHGTGYEYNQYGTFLISRILKIQEIKLHKTIRENIEEVTVGYELYCDINKHQLDSNEKLVSHNSKKSIIEITSSNDFLIRQKLLSYGSNCKILYPESFKNDYISRLKDMKAGYVIG